MLALPGVGSICGRSQSGPTINTIRSTVRRRAVQLLLTLLRLKLLHMLLFLEHLLPLNSGEEVVSLEVFGVVMADALLLHLSELLQRH